MVIYTRKGDRGRTSLYDPQNKQNVRVDKDSARIAAIGSVDELNSHLGLVTVTLNDPKIVKFVKEIQSDLLRIGSILAGSKLTFSSYKTKKLEREIDKLEGSLPVLSKFILPGGSIVAANFHVARSIARRVEREVVKLSKFEAVTDGVLTYLNRLSDYLFMAARNVNSKLHIKDEVWSPVKK